MTKRRYLRFLWSHEADLHRAIVRTVNRILGLVSFRLKYAVGARLRRHRYPYRLTHGGKTVVQVGAPWDTLYSGRSRALYFAIFSGPAGRVIAIEPDEDSAREIERAAGRPGLAPVVVVRKGAWSAPTVLDIYIDPTHPASSFTSGSKDYGERRMQDYRRVQVPADSIDNILDALDTGPVELVSITTNGAEREILTGMRRTIARGLPFIALAETGAVTDLDMRALGYQLHAFDDRGRTYRLTRPPADHD